MDLLGLTQRDIDMMKSLVPEKFLDVKVYAKGKRGVIFQAKLDDDLVAIKVTHPNSDAHNALLLEKNYLAKVNLLGIGPQLLDYGQDYVAMEFIEGKAIGEFIETADATSLKTVLLGIFKQLLKLDKAGINKFELTNPYKHILIKNNLQAVLIDFERARFAARVKNISQFSEYVSNKKILPLLQSKDLLLDIKKFRAAISHYLETGTLVLDNLF